LYAVKVSRPGGLRGHAFISYVREDFLLVERLQCRLEASGIPVWRDTVSLWPGEDWRANIKRAITDDALAFVACFSRHGLGREISYQNEELVLAIEQLRLRRPDLPWLIPVRFDDCEIPDRDLGGGRTLSSIQRVDLFGDTADEGEAQLVAAIQRILVRSPGGARASGGHFSREGPAAQSRQSRSRAEPADFPLYPDPSFLEDDRFRPGINANSALLPFLEDFDDAFDPRHFIECASGAGPILGPADQLIGCFTGRDRELGQLLPWLNGEAAGSLAVVTGSPGTGKSALIGVLVCASHPQLRALTRDVWDRVAEVPSRIPGLAVVHARQRSTATVAASLARQLRLGDVAAPGELIRIASKLPSGQIVVLDALDEADDAVCLMRELLLPLACARLDDGRSAVRLLVGVRPYPEYAQLLEAARTDGFVADLDTVGREILENDLYRYVVDLMRSDPVYRERGPACGALAGQVSRVLAAVADGSRGWGAFTAARMFIRNLLASRGSSPLTVAEAEDLGSRIPPTLLGILDLDLAGARHGALLRRVLSVVADARGQGMPLTVISRIVIDLWPEAADARIREALQQGRFYLRQATDTDGRPLYRLFHEGLTGNLREELPGLILPSLMEPLGPAGARTWGVADPYILRHAFEHAAEAGKEDEILADPGFLIYADQAVVEPLLTGPLQAVFLASLETSGTTSRVDRGALALNASLAGLSDLAERTESLPAERPLSWNPRWAIGRVDTGLLNIRTSVLITWGADGAIKTWDSVTHEQVGEPIAGGHGAIISAAVIQADDRPLIAAGNEDGTVQLWDLKAGRAASEATSGHGQGMYGDGFECYVTAVAAGRRNGENIVVTGGMDGAIRIWSIDGMTPVGKRMTIDYNPALRIEIPTPSQSMAVRSLVLSELDAGLAALVSRDDDRLILWDLGSFKSKTLDYFAAATGKMDGKPVAISVGKEGMVIWDITSRRRAAGAVSGSETVIRVATSVVDGRLLAITTSRDGSIRVWDLAARHQIGHAMAGHTSAICRPAVGTLRGEPVAATGDDDGEVRIWDIRRYHQRGAALKAHDAPVLGVGLGEISWGSQAKFDRDAIAAIARLRHDRFSICQAEILERDGRPVAVLTDSSGRQLAVELATGRQLLAASIPDGEGSADLIDRSASGEGPLPQISPASSLELVLTSGERLTLRGNRDGTVSVMDSPNSSAIGRLLPVKHEGGVSALSSSYFDGRQLVYSGGIDGTVKICDLMAQHLLDVIEMPGPVTALASSDKGYLLAITAGTAIAFKHQETNEAD
jgi:WD40 repeat protein